MKNAHVLIANVAFQQLEQVPARVAQRIVERLEDIAMWPRSGRLCPFEGLEGFRELIIEGCRVFYEEKASPPLVTVLWIQPGRMQPPSREALEEAAASASVSGLEQDSDDGEKFIDSSAEGNQ